MKQPNIILLMTDQLRADALGYAGHPFHAGVQGCPSCIAARAALHTGMEQSHHGRVGYEDNVPWRYPHTMAGELSKAGYYTQCVGKMHVYPLRNYLGFHNVDLHDGYLHSARYGHVPYRESQFVADDYFHWLRQELGADADVTDTGIDCNSWVARPWTHEEKYHPTNWVTDRCLDFLRRRDPDQPFFLMASYLRPHPPLDAPQYYFDLYKDKDLRKPFVGSWETDQFLRRDGRIFDSKTGPIDPELIRQAQIGYYACITHLDHQIGRLIMALIEQEVYDDTVILFTADHGEELCDHHMFRKSRPYEGSCRVPFFLTAGKNTGLHITPASTCHSVVELRDVMPTLLSLAGAPIPDTVDGYDLLPLARDPEGTVRPWLHGEHSYGEFSNHWIVTETDKYIWFPVTGQEQYFDLASDPHELTDRIDDPEVRERVSYLRSCLIQSLTGRPEGFTDGEKLIPGRPYPETMDHLRQAD